MRGKVVKLNKLYNEDCLNTMKKMSSNFIDLVVTSPPYDNLRKYQGYQFDFDRIATELFRVLKEGGIIVWVVGDATIKRSETGTSFKQALFFKELGLCLYDTMIFKKHGMPTDPRLRYYQRFEYMFVLSKGKPHVFNPIQDVVSSGRKQSNGSDRRGDTLICTNKKYQTPKYSIRGNIWEYDTRNLDTQHPAAFPDDLARDHIISWTQPNNIVYDPMAGRGTTCRMAYELKRKYIGSEISAHYCTIAKQEYNKLNILYNVENS